MNGVTVCLPVAKINCINRSRDEVYQFSIKLTLHNILPYTSIKVSYSCMYLEVMMLTK